MENTIVLNSGEKIEVLFCDEVSLDIDCGLRYIASGKQEIEQYVNEVSKPTLDAVISKAQTDMAEQIAQGIEDASSSAAQSAQNTIDAFVTINKGEIDAYMSTSIIPAMDEKLTLVKEYADNAETHAQEATSQSAQATQKAAEAEQSAQEASVSASSAADSAALAIAKSSFGNIGDIKYTTRTDVPNGGAWCDGAEYTQAAFPDIYQMLVDGKISSTDFATFNDSVSTNGSCGLFALDTATTSFKVPLLKDIYIKASDTTMAFAGINLNSQPTDISVDYVVYRAYVVLYASAAETSEAQVQEFMTALGSKLNVDLSNVKPAQSFIDLSIGWGIPDYTSKLTVEYPYTAPCAGIANIRVGNSGSDSVFVNDIEIGLILGGGGVDSVTIFLDKNDVLNLTGNVVAIVEYFPFKGVNNV